jgi:hypothetical protein
VYTNDVAFMYINQNQASIVTVIRTCTLRVYRHMPTVTIPVYSVISEKDGYAYQNVIIRILQMYRLEHSLQYYVTNCAPNQSFFCDVKSVLYINCCISNILLANVLLTK